MAATTNRRFTELYRNSTVFETKQAAITGLYNHELINSLKDGEPLLARYMAYFTWDEGSKQYVLQSTKNDSATFTRIVSNETSVTSTKEYIVGDIINVTATEGNITTTKSYKCSSIPQGGVAVPVGSNFATSGYFTEITSASVTPQSVKTIRVLMAVATVFEDNSGNPSFKKEPPKGRLTIFEEDDAIREMINKASISSPDGTININDVVFGKEIQVNLGTSLVKNTETGVNKGKIDVNFDNKTIKQYASDYADEELRNKLYVYHGDTIKESDNSGEEGKLDVKTGNTLKVSDGTGSGPDAGTIDVYHGDTLVESSTNGEVGKLDVRTGTSLKVSNGGPNNPDAGTIDVNIDNQSIKQYDSNYATAALQNKLYVNVDNTSGLNLHSTNGIQVRLGKALGFRSGETGASASDNGKIDVQYDDNTIGLNESNQLVTNFHSGTAGDSTTMERKSHESEDSIVYDGWGVKHGSTISEDTDGIHVNIDDVSIKQIETGDDADKLYVNHDSTIVTDTTNGIGVNIDNKSIKQIETGDDADKLYVNIDNWTIKQYAHDHAAKADQLYVNIDKSTLVSDPTTGVISVSPTVTNIYGENAIKVETHYDNTDPEHPVADGKTVKLDIDSDDPNVLSQSNSGLKVNLNLRPCTAAELANLGTNVKEAYKLVGNAGSSETQIGSTIKIYKDGSLYTVYLGTTDDTMTNMYAWSDGTDTVYTNKATGILINTDKVYSKDQDSDTYTEGDTITGYDADAKTIEVNDNAYTYVDYATPWIVVDGTSTEESLNFVYEKADGSYELVKVNLESFLQEAEFKDGLNVNSDTHEVSVKLWNGLVIHSITGENGAIEAKIGNGLVFGTGTEGQKPVEVRLGSGLSFDTGTEESPITDGVRPIKVNIGEGLVMDNNNIKVNLGTGLGFDVTSGNEGKIYINYTSIGAANRPVYWDGTNHSPVQIDYEINKSVPADAVFTDTTYSSGNEITIDPTNNHINHNAKLGTAFVPTTVGTTISGFGGSGSFKVPILSINEYGHVTGASEATMTIAIPEAKIVTYTAPQYTQGHLSQNWVTTYSNNAIAVGEIYDSAINKLDNKIKVLADELSDAEAVLTQAIEDEPRYYAKSSSAGDASAITATLVDSRKFAVDGNNSNKPLNGTKVDVYFSTAHTTSTATLNINNTGAFPLVYNDANFDATLIQAGTTLALVFDKEYNSNAGCYRVVGGVGSGSGSTNGITEIDEGNGISITKNYDEVQINPNATPYSSTWFTLNAGADPVVPITPENDKVYRVTTSGNYYNMAYIWDAVNSKYVLSTDISVTAAVKLAANMIPEGSTSGGASEISGLATLLKFTTTGELAMENTWDCGTY